MINFDDFKKIELITARVISVRDHPNADKLLILEVQTAECEEKNGAGANARKESIKEIVAGIKGIYSKEELIGKQIVMVNNLEPATIRGIVSNGMLLAAQDENGLSLITPEKNMKPGSKIK
ncbi:MAG: methionine--tRNA ligase subunit beta [Candidatus Omnitrophica bacterium]|nr:methionine--tRNA ligase subunit beta [Candidatus Omnitrophota bacterium]